MKKLALRHAFTLARIIKAADIRSEVVAFASEFREGKDVNEVGMEFILTMIQAAADETVEKKIYQLYADLKGTNADEVADYLYLSQLVPFACHDVSLRWRDYSTSAGCMLAGC